MNHINQDRLVNSFLEYVQIDSPTKSEREFGLHIKGILDSLGFTTKVDDCGEKIGSNFGNLIAVKKGNTGRPILFSCHLDTVSPGIGIKPHIKDGVIYSDGTTILAGDDKAGIAAIIEAIRVVIEQNLDHPDIEISFSVFEEGGLFGAKNLDFSQFSSKEAFILDSGGDPGEIIIAGPAQSKLDFTIHGKPAHAGVCPEEGVSAIMVAARAIERMKLLRIDSETTANIGSITGGTVTNIVADKCVVKAEARSLSDEKLEAQNEHMVKCFEQACAEYGARLESSVVLAYGAFNIDPESSIVKNVQQAMLNAGIKPFVAKSGGGSDTNVFNANGIQAVNLGIGERKPHTLEEHMHIKDLVSSSRIVLELIKLYSTL